MDGLSWWKSLVFTWFDLLLHTLSEGVLLTHTFSHTFYPPHPRLWVPFRLHATGFCAVYLSICFCVCLPSAASHSGDVWTHLPRLFLSSCQMNSSRMKSYREDKLLLLSAELIKPTPPFTTAPSSVPQKDNHTAIVKTCEVPSLLRTWCSVWMLRPIKEEDATERWFIRMKFLWITSAFIKKLFIVWGGGAKEPNAGLPQKLVRQVVD